jgi:3-oxoacyl-[acyl-carrier protein] reductase
MMNSVTKSAIVTGASGGIGGSVAKRLAKDGFAVIVNYAGKATPAQVVVEEIKAAGGQAIAVQADVANAARVERLFEESMDAFGEPDVVVHCAGIMPLFQISGGEPAPRVAGSTAKFCARMAVSPERAALKPRKGHVDERYSQ